MCGIVGVYNRKLTTAPASIINSLKHRGPDQQNYYCDSIVLLGHTRLAIQDLSDAGAQPMESECGQYIIIYNGEIYNASEIKRRYLTKYLFKGHSDTEVILQAFVEKGVEIFAELNGMFAFAIYDKKYKELYLVRDRFGIKPLYYRYKGNGLTFGSEIKAILATDSFNKNLNYQALYEYLNYATTLGENTVYEGIKKLLPATYIKLNENGIEIKQYIDPYDLNEIHDDFDTAKRKILALLEESVKSHLVSDVPVGLFLSGGIDSSAICAFASKHSDNKLQTFSAGFDYDRENNELEKARQIANCFNTEHQEFYIQGNDIPTILDELAFYYDQPFGDAANIPLYLMTKELKGKSKVILQGDGGDELFAGYHRYRRFRNHHWLRPLSKLIFPLLNKLPKKYHNRIRTLYSLYQPQLNLEHAYIMSQHNYDVDILSCFTGEFAKKLSDHDPYTRYKYYYERFADKEYVQRMLYTDMNVILPDLYFEKVDRATMANSIEIRVPFLENDIASYAMSLPVKYKVNSSMTKFILRKAMEEVLPRDILYAPKQGFGVPYKFWLRESIHGHLKEVLLDTSLSEIFNKNKIELLINEHKQQKNDHGYLLWLLLVFGIFYNKNF